MSNIEWQQPQEPELRPFSLQFKNGVEHTYIPTDEQLQTYMKLIESIVRNVDWRLDLERRAIIWKFWECYRLPPGNWLWWYAYTCYTTEGLHEAIVNLTWSDIYVMKDTSWISDFKTVFKWVNWRSLVPDRSLRTHVQQ